MSNKGQCWRLQLQREKKWTWLKPPGPSKAERQHSLLEAACVCYGAYSPVSLRLHTGHCPSYTVYSGLQPLCSKVHAYYYYTVSGLAVCLLLFFFYIFGKKTFSEEARCEAKVWMDTVLLFSIWLGFPLSWNFFTSKWFVSQIFLANTFVHHHHEHQHTKSLLFLMWWSTLICSLRSSTHGFKAVLLWRPHGKGCFLPMSSKRSMPKSFAKIFDQLH